MHKQRLIISKLIDLRFISDHLMLFFRCVKFRVQLFQSLFLLLFNFVLVGYVRFDLFLLLLPIRAIDNLAVRSVPDRFFRLGVIVVVLLVSRV